MLANTSPLPGARNFHPDVQEQHTFKRGLLDFIATELPVWRDLAQRRNVTQETRLTDQLCSHLQSATIATAWDCVQFRTEVPDDTKGNTTIDLAAKSKDRELIVGGIRYTPLDTLLPIECKRLPTPKDKKRDEREYVFSEPKAAGGIQRFKHGLHGAAHDFAAMIAYVQVNTSSYWLERVNGWISELSISHGPLWSLADRLQLSTIADSNGVTRMNSMHTRTNGTVNIVLEHLWVRM